MTEINLKSDVDVEYVQHVGTDSMIAHAAWVSTRGMLDDYKKWEPAKVEKLIGFLMEPLYPDLSDTGDPRVVRKGVPHGTPFECGALTVRVHAPIKVWREWHRHRVGWSYNEESGRYKQLDPVFYIPPRDRPMIRPEDFKSSRPSFDVATDENYEKVCELLKHGYGGSYVMYEEMLRLGVDRGLARDVLGVGIYSACYCTSNPRGIMNFLRLRTDDPSAERVSKPLYEIDTAARKLEKIFAGIWPVTYRLWCEKGRIGL